MKMAYVRTGKTMGVLLTIAMCSCGRPAAEPPRDTDIARGLTDTPAGAAVQKQVEAYNQHDIERFAATYSEDVQVQDMDSGKIVINGKSELREIYGKLFSKYPDVHADILERKVEGNRFVTDHERTTVGEKVIFEGDVRYELQNGLIVRVVLVTRAKP